MNNQLKIVNHKKSSIQNYIPSTISNYLFKTPGFRSNNRSLEVERDFYQKSEDYEELSEDYNIEGSLVG